MVLGSIVSVVGGRSRGELGDGVISTMVHWAKMTTPCTPHHIMMGVVGVMWRHEQHGLQIH